MNRNKQHRVKVLDKLCIYRYTYISICLSETLSMLYFFYSEPNQENHCNMRIWTFFVHLNPSSCHMSFLQGARLRRKVNLPVTNDRANAKVMLMRVSCKRVQGKMAGSLICLKKYGGSWG